MIKQQVTEQMDRCWFCNKRAHQDFPNIIRLWLSSVCVIPAWLPLALKWKSLKKGPINTTTGNSWTYMTAPVANQKTQWVPNDFGLSQWVMDNIRSWSSRGEAPQHCAVIGTTCWAIKFVGHKGCCFTGALCGSIEKCACFLRVFDRRLFLVKNRLACKTSLKPCLDFKETIFLWHCTTQLRRNRLYRHQD